MGPDARGVPQELSREEAAFLDALDYWFVEPSQVATGSGVVRPCVARDPALLDLAPLAGTTVAIADLERDDWDARLLAGTLSSSPWAARTGTRFRPAPLGLLEKSYERRIVSADFAALHDAPERRIRLIEKLQDFRRDAGADCSALLLGPWLGIERDTVREVTRAVEMPVGECTSLPGGPSGLRFARARDRLLAQLSVQVRRQRVGQVVPTSAGWQVIPEGTDSGRDQRAAGSSEFPFVIVAVGGLAGGGLEFAPRQGSGAPFRLRPELPVVFSFGDEPLEQVSSTYGFDPLTARGAWIEKVGVLADAEGRAGPAGLWFAGDLVAGAPRTVLAGVRSALAAVGALPS
jgi:hypothetical protein